MTNLLRDWLHGLRRLGAGPRSLERSLALTVGGLLLAAIAVLAFNAVGLLRKQAEQEALARVQLAGIGAREAVRRLGEDTVTSARALAARPSLPRLIREGNVEQLELFLRRSCEVAGMGACAVLIGPSTVLASTRPDLGWIDLLEQTSEQGERFALAPASVPDGLQGAVAPVPALIETRVVVVRYLDGPLARKLAGEAGMDIRFVRLSKWLDNVEPSLRQLHSSALSSASTAAERIRPLDLFASSTLITASTGEPQPPRRPPGTARLVRTPGRRESCAWSERPISCAERSRSFQGTRVRIRRAEFTAPVLSKEPGMRRVTRRISPFSTSRATIASARCP